MGSSLPSRCWMLLFLFCSSFTFEANALQMPEPFYVSSNVLMINETGPLLASPAGAANEPSSFGIHFYRGSVPILPQAVGGIISQALYKAYLELGISPLDSSLNFEHAYAEADFARVCFEVGIAINALEVEGQSMLTHRRIATVLSLMGFDFSEEDNLVDLREYTFDIIVSNPRNTTTIGKGALRNTNPLKLPVRLGNGLSACGVSGRSKGATS
ncbi:MAG: hypothetical protein Q9215_000453 [Flavoplaca cf. flavocitrina]